MASKVSVYLAILVLLCYVVSITEGFGANAGNFGKRSVKVLRLKRTLKQDLCLLALKHCSQNNHSPLESRIARTVHLKRRELKSDDLELVLRDLCDVAALHCNLQQFNRIL